MAVGPNPPPRIRYIDVCGLPPGFDAADLILDDSGEVRIAEADLIAWLKQHVRDFDPESGIPAPIAAVPDKPKPAAPEGTASSESAPQPDPSKGKGKPT